MKRLHTSFGNHTKYLTQYTHPPKTPRSSRFQCQAGPQVRRSQKMTSNQTAPLRLPMHPTLPPRRPVSRRPIPRPQPDAEDTGATTDLPTGLRGRSESPRAGRPRLPGGHESPLRATRIPVRAPTPGSSGPEAPHHI